MNRDKNKINYIKCSDKNIIFNIKSFLLIRYCVNVKI